MRIRGSRECQSCGHRWSYYDTGRVDCPSCGSLRSVGVDERTRHTAGPADHTLDLSPHRRGVDEGSVADVADELKRDLRQFRHGAGFIRAGELLALSETYLAATELLYAVGVYVRTGAPTDEERLYILDLLRGADTGERPDPASVPESMRAARGLAYAEAVAEYRGEVLTWLDDSPDPAARRTLGTAGELVRRIRALDGDVPLDHAERLVQAIREVTQYLDADDEAALATAQERLRGLVEGAGG